MSRMEISMAKSMMDREEYEDKCGQTLEYFTQLIYEDYLYKSTLNVRTLDEWLNRLCWEGFGIEESDAYRIVSQAMSDGYMRWIRERIRRCVTVRPRKN